MLIISVHSKLPIILAVLLLTTATGGVANADVTINACIANNSIHYPLLVVDMQSLCGMSSSVGALLGFSTSGLAVHHLGAQEATRSMWTALKCPEVWRPSLYMYISLAIGLNIQEGPKPGFPCHFFDDINERAGIIYKIMLASKCLEHIKIIAFVGPQNGGKTTLINALLSDEVATVGFTSHTSKVVPYLVDGSTVIVDFPGTEATSDRQEMPAAWEEFQRVPELLYNPLQSSSTLHTHKAHSPVLNLEYPLYHGVKSSGTREVDLPKAIEAPVSEMGVYYWHGRSLCNIAYGNEVLHVLMDENNVAQTMTKDFEMVSVVPSSFSSLVVADENDALQIARRSHIS
eukprot:Gb_36412 [translate_table: standard]